MENPEITQLKKIIEDKTKQELQERIETLTKENEILKQMNAEKIGRCLSNAFEKIGGGLINAINGLKESPISSELATVMGLNQRSEDLKNKAIIKVLEELEQEIIKYLHCEKREDLEKLSLLDSTLTYDVVTDFIDKKINELKEVNNE